MTVELPPSIPAQSVWIGLGTWIGAVHLWWRTRRLRGRQLEALAVAGLCGTAGLVGARLLSMAMRTGGGASPALADWLVPWRPGFASFGLLGGAGLVAGLYLWRRGLDRGLVVLDRLVPAGFVALAVARIGCLANGCDFGRPTGGPWGLRYPRGTEVWQLHHELGLVASHASWSAPTHPLPLYLVGGVLGIVVTIEVLERMSKWPAGCAALGMTIGYLALRLAAEAWRDPHAASAVWAGLSLSQWLALGAALPVGILGWLSWHTHE